MKVSRRTEYGLRALVSLTERSRDTGIPVSLREIALQEEIPEAFLDQIFGSLRREGLVTSVRGAGGGFLLAGAPQSIQMSTVIRALEGGFSPMGCVSDEFASPEDFCAKASHCHTRSVWQILSEAIERALSGITLADVLEDRLAHDPAGHSSAV